MGELYANPQITQTMLDDSFLNVEAELIDHAAGVYLGGGWYAFDATQSVPKGGRIVATSYFTPMSDRLLPAFPPQP